MSLCKRTLSIIVCFTMLMSVFTISGFQASAAKTESNSTGSYSIPRATDRTIKKMSSGERGAIQWYETKSWSQLRNALESTSSEYKYVRLSGNVEEHYGKTTLSAIKIKGEKILDLNGHRFAVHDDTNVNASNTNAAGVETTMFQIEKTGDMLITDSSGDNSGSITSTGYMLSAVDGNVVAYTHRDIFNVIGKLTINGGTIIAGREKFQGTESDWNKFKKVTSTLCDYFVSTANSVANILTAADKIKALNKAELEAQNAAENKNNSDLKTDTSSGDAGKTPAAPSSGTATKEEKKENPDGSEKEKTADEKKKEDEKKEKEDKNKLGAGTVKDVTDIVSGTVDMIDKVAEICKSGTTIVQYTLGKAVKVKSGGTLIVNNGEIYGTGQTDSVRECVIESQVNSKVYLNGGKFVGKGGADVIHNYDVNALNVRGGEFECRYKFFVRGLNKTNDEGKSEPTVFMGTPGNVDISESEFDKKLIHDGRIQVEDTYGFGQRVCKDTENNCYTLVNYNKNVQYLKVYPKNDSDSTTNKWYFKLKDRQNDYGEVEYTVGDQYQFVAPYQESDNPFNLNDDSSPSNYYNAPINSTRIGQAYYYGGHTVYEEFNAMCVSKNYTYTLSLIDPVTKLEIETLKQIDVSAKDNPTGQINLKSFYDGWKENSCYRITLTQTETPYQSNITSNGRYCNSQCETAVATASIDIHTKAQGKDYEPFHVEAYRVTDTGVNGAWVYAGVNGSALSKLDKYGRIWLNAEFNLYVNGTKTATQTICDANIANRISDMSNTVVFRDVQIPKGASIYCTLNVTSPLWDDCFNGVGYWKSKTKVMNTLGTEDSSSEPIITAQPIDKKVPVCRMNTITCQAVSPGDGGKLTYKWYKRTSIASNDNFDFTGKKYSEVPLVTSYNCVVTTGSAEANQYYCEITNAKGETVTSDVCTVIPQHGVQLTTSQSGDFLTKTVDKLDSSGYSYNASTNTLTLKNYTSSILNTQFGIISDVPNKPLNIILKGNNTISVDYSNASNPTYVAGIFCDNGINISGDGNLTINMSKTKGNNYVGICAPNEGVALNGTGQITLNFDDKDRSLLKQYMGIYSYGISFNGGTVEFNAENALTATNKLYGSLLHGSSSDSMMDYGLIAWDFDTKNINFKAGATKSSATDTTDLDAMFTNKYCKVTLSDKPYVEPDEPCTHVEGEPVITDLRPAGVYPEYFSGNITQRTYCVNCGKEMSFHAEPISTAWWFELEFEETPFNGMVQKPSITVRGLNMDKNIIPEEGNYIIEYENKNSKLPGTYKMTLTFFGKYTGVYTTEYKITESKVAIKSVKLSKTTYTYNGKAQKPAVTVTDKYGNKVPSGSYSVKYDSGCKNVGKYKVTVKGKGYYSGSVSKTFIINPKATTVSKVTPAKKYMKVSVKKQTTQTTGYEVQYGTKKNFKSAKKYTIKKAKTTKVTIKKLTSKKTYYVRVRTFKTVGKTKYYSAWSKAKSVKIK